MAAQDTKRDADQVRVDIEKLKADIAALTDSLKTLAGDVGVEGASAVRAAGQKTREHVNQAAETVEQQIVERPFSSVLVAFGVGLLLGKLLDRR